MPLTDLVVVTVSSQGPGVTQAGFGVPLIASQNATFAERSRAYTDADDVAADPEVPGGTNSPEYAAAARIFQQDPRPERIRIGRCPTGPIKQRYKVSVVSAAVGKTYKIKVWSPSGANQTASYATTAASNKGFVNSSAEPFVLLPGEHWDVSIDQAANQVYTFGGTQGLKDGAAGVFAGVAGTVVLRVDEKPAAQDITVTFDGSENSLAKALQRLNDSLLGGTALDTGAGQIRLRSDRFGTGSNMRVVSGTGATLVDLGLAAGLGTAGTATIAKTGGGGARSVAIEFLDDATAAELAAAFVTMDGFGEDITGGSLTDNGDGTLHLETDTAGASPKGVQVKNVSTELLGFDTAEHNGSATGGATNDEIVQGLKDAIDALVGIPSVVTTLQGAGGSKTLRVEASTTAVWVGLEIVDPALLSQEQDHAAPSGIGGATLATDLAAINDESVDWYGLITLYNSSAYVLAAAAWVEANQKLYPVAVCDTPCATTPDIGATDSLHQLKSLSYLRTAGFFHPRPQEFADAAELGRFFPISPGSDNWRLKTLSGVTSGWGTGKELTTTQMTNIRDRRAAFYYILGGISLVGGNGTVARNEYIDVVRGIDWWVARLQERLANLLIQSEKVPMTDAGLGLIEAEVRAQNDEGVAAGVINPGSPPEIAAPSVWVPRAGQIAAADRQLRQVPGVRSRWTLAGAINKLTVNATITA